MWPVLINSLAQRADGARVAGFTIDGNVLGNLDPVENPGMRARISQQNGPAVGLGHGIVCNPLSGRAAARRPVCRRQLGKFPP